MKFNIYLPCDLLKPYVRTLAIAESGEAKAYKVFPDTGLIICLPYKVNPSAFNRENHFLMKGSGVT
jgi:hypothetical protein